MDELLERTRLALRAYAFWHEVDDDEETTDGDRAMARDAMHVAMLELGQVAWSRGTDERDRLALLTTPGGRT